MSTLNRYANCYRTDGSTSFWQHLKTGNFFSLTQVGDRHGYMTLDRRSGAWQDHGVLSLDRVIEIAASFAQ